MNKWYLSIVCLFSAPYATAALDLASGVSLNTLNGYWGHIAIVKAQDSLYTYNDGVLIKKIRFPWLDRQMGSSSDIKLGDTWVGPEYDGLLDDFRFYDRPLKPSEVYLLSERITSKTCYQTVYDTVKVAVTDTLKIDVLVTGIGEEMNTQTIKIYPNPAKSYINIDYSGFTT